MEWPDLFETSKGFRQPQNNTESLSSLFSKPLYERGSTPKEHEPHTRHCAQSSSQVFNTYVSAKTYLEIAPKRNGNNFT